MSGEGDVPDKMDAFDGSDFAGLNFESGFESILEQGASSSLSFVASQQNSNSNYGPQCSRCDTYRTDLERKDQEHRMNFQFLKKKIISTDLLIRRYKAKTDESEAQCRTIEDLNSRLEQADRDAAILSEQLNSAVENMKPLKEENERLGLMLHTRESEVGELHNRLAAEEAYKNQRQALDLETKNRESEAVALNKKIKSLELKTQRLLTKTHHLDREKTAVTSEKNIMSKRMTVFAKALHQAQEIVNTQWRKLQMNKLTIGDRRPYVIPKKFKSFIAKVQAGETVDDGEVEEISDNIEPEYGPLVDIGEMSDNEDDEEERDERNRSGEMESEGGGKGRELAGMSQEKKEKKAIIECRSQKEGVGEEESDSDLSNVGVLSDGDELGGGGDGEKGVGEKEEKGVGGKVKNNRRSFGFECNSIGGDGGNGSKGLQSTNKTSKDRLGLSSDDGGMLTRDVKKSSVSDLRRESNSPTKRFAGQNRSGESSSLKVSGDDDGMLTRNVKRSSVSDSQRESNSPTKRFAGQNRSGESSSLKVSGDDDGMLTRNVKKSSLSDLRSESNSPTKRFAGQNRSDEASSSLSCDAKNKYDGNKQEEKEHEDGVGKGCDFGSMEDGIDIGGGREKGVASSCDGVKMKRVQKISSKMEKSLVVTAKGVGEKDDALSSLSSLSSDSDEENNDKKNEDKRGEKTQTFSNITRLALPAKLRLSSSKNTTQNQRNSSDLGEDAQDRKNKSPNKKVRKMNNIAKARSSHLQRKKRSSLKIDEKDDDLDSLSSLSDDTSDEEENNRKYKTSSPKRSMASSLGDQLKSQEKSGFPSNNDSLSEASDDENNEPHSLPFSSIGDGEEENSVSSKRYGAFLDGDRTIESFGKAELQSLLELSPICQLLSPLPPSPCTSVSNLIDEDDDDDCIGGDDVVGGGGGGGDDILSAVKEDDVQCGRDHGDYSDISNRDDVNNDTTSSTNSSEKILIGNDDSIEKVDGISANEKKGEGSSSYSIGMIGDGRPQAAQDSQPAQKQDTPQIISDEVLHKNKSTPVKTLSLTTSNQKPDSIEDGQSREYPSVNCDNDTSAGLLLPLPSGDHCHERDMQSKPTILIHNEKAANSTSPVKQSSCSIRLAANNLEIKGGKDVGNDDDDDTTPNPCKNGDGGDKENPGASLDAEMYCNSLQSPGNRSDKNKTCIITGISPTQKQISDNEKSSIHLDDEQEKIIEKNKDGVDKAIEDVSGGVRNEGNVCSAVKTDSVDGRRCENKQVDNVLSVESHVSDHKDADIDRMQKGKANKGLNVDADLYMSSDDDSKSEMGAVKSSEESISTNDRNSLMTERGKPVNVKERDSSSSGMKESEGNHSKTKKWRRIKVRQPRRVASGSKEDLSSLSSSSSSSEDEHAKDVGKTNRITVETEGEESVTGDDKGRETFLGDSKTSKANEKPAGHENVNVSTDEEESMICVEKNDKLKVATFESDPSVVHVDNSTFQKTENKKALTQTRRVPRRKCISKEYIELNSLSEGSLSDENGSAKKCKLDERNLLSGNETNNEELCDIPSQSRRTRLSTRLRPSTDLNKSEVAVSKRVHKGAGSADWSTDENSSSVSPRRSSRGKDSENNLRKSSLDKLGDKSDTNVKETEETGQEDTICSTDQEKNAIEMDCVLDKNSPILGRKTQMECAAQQLAKMIAKAKSGKAQKGGSKKGIMDNGDETMPPKLIETRGLGRPPRTRMVTRRSSSRIGSESGHQREKGVSNEESLQEDLQQVCGGKTQKGICGDDDDDDTRAGMKRLKEKDGADVEKDIVIQGGTDDSGNKKDKETPKDKVTRQISNVVERRVTRCQSRSVSNSVTQESGNDSQDRGRQQQDYEEGDNDGDSVESKRRSLEGESLSESHGFDGRSPSVADASRSGVAGDGIPAPCKEMGVKHNRLEEDSGVKGVEMDDDSSGVSPRRSSRLKYSDHSLRKSSLDKIGGKTDVNVKENKGACQNDAVLYTDPQGNEGACQNDAILYTDPQGNEGACQNDAILYTDPQGNEGACQNDAILYTDPQGNAMELDNDKGHCVENVVDSIMNSVPRVKGVSLASADDFSPACDAIPGNVVDDFPGTNTVQCNSNKESKEPSSVLQEGSHVSGKLCSVLRDSKIDAVTNCQATSTNSMESEKTVSDKCVDSDKIVLNVETTKEERVNTLNSVSTPRRTRLQSLNSSANSAFSPVLSSSASPNLSTVSTVGVTSSASSSSSLPNCPPSQQPLSVGRSPSSSQTLAEIPSGKSKRNTKNKKERSGKYIPPLGASFVPAHEPNPLNQNLTTSKELSDSSQTAGNSDSLHAGNASRKEWSNSAQTGLRPKDGSNSKSLNPSLPLEVIIPVSSPSPSPYSKLSSSLSTPSPAASTPDLSSSSSTKQIHQTTSQKPFGEILKDMVNFFHVSPLISPISSPSPSPTSSMWATPSNGAQDLTSSRLQSTVAAPPKPSPKSSSDSQMMMQAKRLLAKRKASSMNATQCTEGIKRSKRLSGREGQSQGPQKAVEEAAKSRIKPQQNTISFSGFSSLQDAIDYHLRHLLPSSNASGQSCGVQATVEDIGARVKDGNVTEVWLCLVNRTILHVRRFGPQKSSSFERLCQSNSPSNDDGIHMEPLELSLLDLMTAFMDKYTGSVDKSVLMGSIWSAIFDRSLTSTGVRLCLCRLFCGLCKRFDDPDQARILLYNIAWCGYLHFSCCLLSMAGVWPSVVLPTPTADSSPSLLPSPISRVFHLVLSMEQEKDPALVGSVMSVLERLCGWKLNGFQAHVAHNLLKLLLDAMIEMAADSNGDMFEYTKAVELLCMVQGSEWTQDQFVQKGVVGTFHRWHMASSLSACADAMMALLTITKAVLAVHSFSETTVKVLGGQVFGKVVVTRLDSLPLTICFGEVLMELCPLDSQLCLEFLRQWEETNRGRLPLAVVDQLAKTRTFITARNNQKAKAGNSGSNKANRSNNNNNTGGKKKKKKKGKGKKT